MLFEKWLLPDWMPAHYYDITPETVLGAGKRVLLCDIDNTLATYDDPLPPPRLTAWIEDMRRAGVSIAFVSNNRTERVDLFNEPLGCVAYGDAGKPGTKFLKAACTRLGVSKEQAILLGDQLLTDCAAGKRFGIPAWIVPPIRDKKTPFFRFKRWLEKPYVKKYRRLHPDDAK